MSDVHVQSEPGARCTARSSPGQRLGTVRATGTELAGCRSHLALNRFLGGEISTATVSHRQDPSAALLASSWEP